MYIHMYMYLNSLSFVEGSQFWPNKVFTGLFILMAFAGELLLDPVDISVSEFDTGKVRETENASQS